MRNNIGTETHMQFLLGQRSIWLDCVQMVRRFRTKSPIAVTEMQVLPFSGTVHPIHIKCINRITPAP